MVTQASEQTVISSGWECARQGWFIIVQVAVLGLLALALAWARIPVVHYRMLLGLLAVASLLVAAVPAWRRSQAAALLGGVTLAMACWLSAEHTWNLLFFTDVEAVVPLMTPIVAGAALVLAVLGLATRAGIIRGAHSVGNAALAGVVLLVASSLLCYAVINYTQAFRSLEYEISRAQISEMLASILLFLPALWLGGIGVRKENRVTFLPIGTVVVLAVFFIIWQLR